MTFTHFVGIKHCYLPHGTSLHVIPEKHNARVTVSHATIVYGRERLFLKVVSKSYYPDPKTISNGFITGPIYLLEVTKVTYMGLRGT